jgi:hypothetical protein
VPLSDKTIRSSPFTLGISELQRNPTLAEPEPLSDLGTMASAKLGTANEPAVAGKTPLHSGDPQTLSAQSTTTTAASALAVSASRSSAAQRSLYYIGAGLVALLTVGVLVLRKSPSIEPTPAASLGSAQLAAPAPSAFDLARHADASFALEISANTPGAQVFEGETLLGTTPLRLSIDANTVADAPRTFTVKKPGYAPYTIVQGAARTDLSVRAELSPEPLPAPNAPVAKTSKPKKAAPTKPSPTKPAPPSQVPPPDIFMQR